MSGRARGGGGTAGGRRGGGGGGGWWTHRRVRDWVEIKAEGKVTLDGAHKALKGHGIDSSGLDGIDRRVLTVMHEAFGGGPVGVESIAATMNEEPDTLVDVVEPFLLKIGFLKRTPRGREMTKAAYEHMGFASKRKELF